ncbi:MAG: 2OG-Fe(II) oxygenase [Saccharospirillaceae bacterium]|nr:2OG-Fe(II) oxygenase [Pseudomonadales bacterium]NRB79612.1 2OG-Fe(II) oxygenase [Saccharospirillaceae bacterium]
MSLFENENKSLIKSALNIYEIPSFLDQSQCIDLINYSENKGYARADIQIDKTQRKVVDNIRTNDRVLKIDDEMAEALWIKLQSYNLPLFRQRRAIGLSPYFRYYKYSTGQKFVLHRDGSQIVNGHKTLFTLMIYLNQEFEGGVTNFSRVGLDIKPETGKALLFDHKLLHQGCEIISGYKYVLRTDIVFSN